MAKANYRLAAEVKAIAEDLIPKYHQHLVDFDVKLEYVFIDKTPKSKNREIWGKCRKVSGINAFLVNSQNERGAGTDPFFVIEISEPIWDVLPPDKRVALVDHELCHACAIVEQDEDKDDADPVKLSLKPHDLEEFVCVVRRHGLWRDDIEDFVEAALKRKKDDATRHAEEISGT